MTRRGPRILLLGGTYRALCVLERLLERGERVAAFLGQEGNGERDFCPEILEICDRSSVPARSGRKLGEEMVRWLEDRIRPELAIAVGVSTEIPLAIGGNSRLGLVEVIDRSLAGGGSHVVLRQRGEDVIVRPVPPPASDAEEDETDAYLDQIEATLGALDEYLDGIAAPRTELGAEVPFEPERPAPGALQRLVAGPSPGAETDRLEAEVCDYLEAESALALRDPADGFELCARALGLTDGDEVICPALVSEAAVRGLERVGARVLFADLDPVRLGLDSTAAEELVSPRTRALVVAHPFGQPADLAALYGLAEERGLEVIEDGASSFGARFGGSRLGRSPCACVFRMPFGAALPGGAAALLTAPPALAEAILARARGLRVGDGAAALLRRRLGGWEDRLSARRANASHFSAELVRYDAFEVPATPEDSLPAYAFYALRLTRYSRTSAHDLQKLLGESGIETRRVGVPVSERELVRVPVTERIRSGGLLLPVEQGLGEEERERTLDAIFDYTIG